MKKLAVFMIFVLAVCITGCGNVTEEVQTWFTSQSVSSIDYDLDGAVGSAEFTYYSKTNTRLHFTSGEGLEGVSFTLTDGSATATLDGLEWHTEPEMVQLLSLFGEVYSLASQQTYTVTRKNTEGEKENAVVTDTFEYTDGALEVSFMKEDLRPTRIKYTKNGTAVTLDIKDIKLLNTSEEEK